MTYRLGFTLPLSWVSAKSIPLYFLMIRFLHFDAKIHTHVSWIKSMAYFVSGTQAAVYFAWDDYFTRYSRLYIDITPIHLIPSTCLWWSRYRSFSTSGIFHLRAGVMQKVTILRYRLTRRDCRHAPGLLCYELYARRLILYQFDFAGLPHLFTILPLSI